MRMIDWSSYVGSSDLPLRDLRVAAARDEVNSRREQMLADEIIQTTFALGLDQLQARGRPRAQVAAWAHAYLLEEEASETERKSVVSGTSGELRVDQGGRRARQQHTKRTENKVE